jgi:nifR3 family TIM-barrel protein
MLRPTLSAGATAHPAHQAGEAPRQAGDEPRPAHAAPHPAGGGPLQAGRRSGGRPASRRGGIRIGALELESRVMLAPMAGVTDGAFRRLCRELGFRGAVFTEMASVNGLWHNDRKSAELTEISAPERPAAVQLFGADPGMAATIADRLNDAEGISFIDINMGCPMPKITKSGAGAALMLNPELARRLVGAVVRASRYPVTAKIRKGWDSAGANAAEFAKMLEDAGASMITVHGRTREQLYSGKADWNAIAEVKAAVSIPVVGNGDVCCAGDALRMLSATRCDGVMVGRGAQGNPWLLNQISDAMALAAEAYPSAPSAPSLAEKKAAMRRHMLLSIELNGEPVGILDMRKHLAWYVRGMRNAAAIKNSIFSLSDAESILACIDSL